MSSRFRRFRFNGTLLDQAEGGSAGDNIVDGHVPRRMSRITAAGLKEGFDASVFKGIEGHYHQAPAGPQQRLRRLQSPV